MLSMYSHSQNYPFRAETPVYKNQSPEKSGKCELGGWPIRQLVGKSVEWVCGIVPTGFPRAARFLTPLRTSQRSAVWAMRPGCTAPRWAGPSSSTCLCILAFAKLWFGQLEQRPPTIGLLDKAPPSPSQCLSIDGVQFSLSVGPFFGSWENYGFCREKGVYSRLGPVVYRYTVDLRGRILLVWYSTFRKPSRATAQGRLT